MIPQMRKPVLIGVNATLEVNTNRVGTFYAKTAGTLTVQYKTNSVKVLDAFPVTEGQVLDLNFDLGRSDNATMQFITAGGAGGTLAL